MATTHFMKKYVGLKMTVDMILQNQWLENEAKCARS